MTGPGFLIIPNRFLAISLQQEPIISLGPDVPTSSQKGISIVTPMVLRPLFRALWALVLIAYPSSTGGRLLNTFLTVSLQVLSSRCVRWIYHLSWGRSFPPLFSGPFSCSQGRDDGPFFVPADAVDSDLDLRTLGTGQRELLPDPPPQCTFRSLPIPYNCLGAAPGDSLVEVAGGPSSCQISSSRSLAQGSEGFRLQRSASTSMSTSALYTELWKAW
jgi:hypothetical protein